MTIKEAMDEMMNLKTVMNTSTGLPKGFSIGDMWEFAYNLMNSVYVSCGRSNSEMFESSIPAIHN